MFSRKEYKVRLPQIPNPYSDKELREKDSLAKSKMKFYAERKNLTNENEFEVGDSVLVKQI